MARHWKRLCDIATDEVETLIRSLPRDVRTRSKSLPVLFEKRPGKSIIAQGIEAESLGLFEGASLRNGEGSVPVPPRIILYLENIWASTDADETEYRNEIRTTYLHELGHFLGLEEPDLEARSLD